MTVTDRRTDGQTELRWLRRAIAVPAVARKNLAKTLPKQSFETTDVQLGQVKFVPELPDLRLADRVLTAVVSLQFDGLTHRLLERQRLADALHNVQYVT